jgi:hypothetical protein
MPRYLVDEREHRRGLVLGLTLAEVLILLLFLVLLALGSRIVRLQTEASNAQISLAELHTSLPELKVLIDTIQSNGKMDIKDIGDLAKKLSRSAELETKVAQLTRELTELRADVPAIKALGPEATAKVREVAAILERAAKMNPSDPPAALKKALDAFDALASKTEVADLSALSSAHHLLQEKNNSLTVEAERLRRQVENMIRNGKGTTFPSCWADSNGQTEYVFDVTIRDTALVVIDASKARESDEAWKLVDPFDRDVEITGKAFQSATRKMFEWSKEQNCRFFAIIRDGTGPSSKEPYKRMRGLVENHFYPKLMNTLRAPSVQKPPVTETSSIPRAKKESKPSWIPF